MNLRCLPFQTYLLFELIRILIKNPIAMDENHIKTKIERFRKITIDEVQDNFQDYIALDMVDAGEANYLIDDLSLSLIHI